MEPEKYLTISAITRYLKFKFDADDNLKHVLIKGEISNFKAHTTGHYYFSLKDETSKINAIMFRTNTSKLKFQPVDGMKVLVTGRITVYEATGGYQIYVEDMMEDGIGNLYIAFEQLKEQLSKEGLFRAEHKKAIPKIPERIGIITAPTGAAIRDILSTIKRRFPLCTTILFPSLVQGENAASDIAKNIQRAEDFDLDVLIIGRGGGSIEDLWPFNEEVVARAIYHCTIPTISAVGHEVDFTISDFVADLRAPTPTGAAELAVPNIVDLSKHLDQLKIRLNESVLKKVNYLKLYVESVKNSFVIKNPMIMYESRKQQIDLFSQAATRAIQKKLETKLFLMEKIKHSFILTNPEQLYKEKKLKFFNVIEKLELVSPMNVLKRGYSLVYSEEKVVQSVQQLTPQEQIKVKLQDGTVYSTVDRIE